MRAGALLLLVAYIGLLLVVGLAWVTWLLSGGPL